MAFSPDSKHLALASYDRTVKIWDATTSQEARTLKGHTGHVWSGAFSPDGKRLASGSKVWDVQTGQELLSLKGGINIMVFSPDGKRLASSSGGPGADVKVWDGRPARNSSPLKGHTGGVSSVAFSRLGSAWPALSLTKR